MATSRPRPPLGRCPECDTLLDMGDAGRTNAPQQNGPVTIDWRCQYCGSVGVVTVSWNRAHRMFNQWADWLLKEQKSYDTEAVGKQVQGFRIELDVVQTPADIQVVWDAQPRHEIPRGSHV